MAKKNAKSNSKDAEGEFTQLFWEARKAHVAVEKGAAVTNPAHKAAMAFAAARRWSWAQALLEASRLDGKGTRDKSLALLDDWSDLTPERWLGLYHFVRGSAHYGKRELDEAIKAYHKTLNDPKFDRPENAWFNLGLVLATKGEPDEAIKAYHKSLEFTKFETLGSTWNNIGVVLHAKGEYDKAIEAYRKALEDPRYDTPGKAWNNMGIAMGAKGDYEEALKAYGKALDDPKYDSRGKAWNNVGYTLSAKGEHEEAIKAYRKALSDPQYTNPTLVWTNLGQSYAALNKTKQAEEAFKKALESPDRRGSDHVRANFNLQLLQSKIKAQALSPDDRAIATGALTTVSAEDIEGQIIDAIKAAGDTQYDKYLEKEDSGRDNTLSILRGWSSAVTLLEGSERRWRGGGYFLRWRGCGIVIDPGFDFLRNFHDAGYHGREINAVLVSHNHPDHNSDLKHIDDLRYEVWKRQGMKKVVHNTRYLLLWDQDSEKATKFSFDKPEHHYEPIILPHAFPQPINLREHEAKFPFRVIPFKVKHGTDVPNAMGMVVELLDTKGKTALRIGYTADTAYFGSLHKHLINCDILIAHISQPSIDELKDPTKLKEVHLGYRGTLQLLKECKPKLALIGEFWAGFTDLRIALVKGVRQRSGVSAVLPAGLAMHLRLPSLEIECTECKKPTSFSTIRIAPPTDNFGSLAYLCPNCMIG